MPDLLADANIEGHVRALVRIIEFEFGDKALVSLSCRLLELNDVGLNRKSDDVSVWRKAQEIGAIIVTNNRNQKGATSLNSAILNENTLESLPVLTLADSDRMLHDRTYATNIAYRLMEILMEIDLYRGTGRPYLP
jgi:hypothetical protein